MLSFSLRRGKAIGELFIDFNRIVPTYELKFYIARNMSLRGLFQIDAGKIDQLIGVDTALLSLGPFIISQLCTSLSEGRVHERYFEDYY